MLILFTGEVDKVINTGPRKIHRINHGLFLIYEICTVKVREHGGLERKTLADLIGTSGMRPIFFIFMQIREKLAKIISLRHWRPLPHLSAKSWFPTHR